MRIEAYEFGRITIDGRTYQSDVIILPERVIDTWWRRQGHLLQVADVEAVLPEAPEVLVVGQGMPGKMAVDPELVSFLATRGIEVVALPTQAACTRFNELAASRRVAAALHLTC